MTSSLSSSARGGLRRRAGILLASLTLGAFGLAGADTNSAAGAGQPAADPPVQSLGGFDSVAKQLDKGGSFYLYLKLDGAWQSLLDKIGVAAAQTEDMQAQMVVGMARTVGKSIGMTAFNDVGMSTADLGDGRSRGKVFIGLKNNAGIFSVLGPLNDQPSSVDAIASIPADADFALAQTWDGSAILPLVRRVATDVLGPSGAMTVQQSLDDTKQREGVDVEKLLNSFGREAGGYMRFDPQKTVVLESEYNTTFTLSRPAFVLFAQTKDATLREMLLANAKKMQMPTTEVGAPDGSKITVLDNGKNDLDWKLSILQTPTTLYIASDPEEIAHMFEARAKANDLRKNAEYKALAVGAPERVHGFSFVSSNFGKTVTRVIELREKDAPTSSAREEAQRARLFLELTGFNEPKAHWRVNSTEGLLFVTHMQRGSATAAEANAAPAAN